MGIQILLMVSAFVFSYRKIMEGALHPPPIRHGLAALICPKVDTYGASTAKSCDNNELSPHLKCNAQQLRTLVSYHQSFESTSGVLRVAQTGLKAEKYRRREVAQPAPDDFVWFQSVNVMRMWMACHKRHCRRIRYRRSDIGVG